MTVPAFVNAGALVGQSFGTSVTPTLPASLVNGNLLVCVVGNSATNGKVFTFPAGWTIVTGMGNTLLGAAIAYHYVVGGESNPAITWSGSTSAQAQIFQYSGVVSSSPFGNRNVTSGSASPIVNPGISTLAADSLVLSINYTAASVPPTGTPTGYTLENTLSAITVYEEAIATSGNSSTAISQAMSSSLSYASFQLELGSNTMPTRTVLDGIPAVANIGGGTPGTVSVSTGLADDIIVLFIASETNSGTLNQTVASVADTAGLTWHKRAGYVSGGSGGFTFCNLEVWWAHATAALSADTVTVTMTGTIDDGTLCAFGINGADLTTPFDQNVSLPATAQGVSASNPTVPGVSTTAAKAFLFSVYGTRNTGKTSAPNTGWNFLANTTNQGGALWSTQESQYKNVLAAQSNITVSQASGFTASNWGMIVDAIVAAGQGGPPTLSLSVTFTDDTLLDAVISFVPVLQFSVNFNDASIFSATVQRGLNLSVAFSDDAVLEAIEEIIPPPIPPPVQVIVIVVGA